MDDYADVCAAWVDDVYRPWFDAQSGETRGVHTDLGPDGPPPTPPVKK